MQAKTLEDLLKPKVRKSKVVVEKIVNKNSNVAVGIYKIPESDKPFSIYFAKPVVPIKVNNVPVTYKEIVYCVTALLSKFPHYEYRCSCKTIGKPKTYWFLDTSRNVTIILTESEINRKLK